MMNRRFVLKALGLSVGGLLIPASLVHAAMKPRVTDVRFSSKPGRTRIVLSLNQEVKHTLTRQSDPHRAVLELANTEATHHSTLLSYADSIIRRVQTGPLPNGSMRTTFELAQPARTRAFILKDPHGGDPRLVVDFIPVSGQAAQARDEADDDAEPARKSQRKKPITIVLDPGHGGIDPGAIGKRGLREKDVTLEVAKRVAKEINALPGYRAVLTRQEDRFVALSRRSAMANRYGADLFISLHADAFHIASAHGASVYCHSDCEEENGSVDPRSMELGKIMLSAIAKTPGLAVHFKATKQARFAVLRNRNIPSVLVEMAFLSNRNEEVLMRKASHQAFLAQAVSQGAREFARAAGLA
ncbi:MAG: N-acetylmuramoyl-L-alanine amidase [Magnetococcales bacterium]|nr:N-acetylmuramoyl-L-alanine amidase [Magnetococcales bacterium]